MKRKNKRNSYICIDVYINMRYYIVVQRKGEIKMKIENLNLKKAEKAGWAEWKKYGKNRLYFDVKESDLLDLEYYKSGNIDSSHFDDEKISHAEAYRLLASKVYIDLDTMELHVQSDAGEDLIDQLVKHEVKKIVDEPKEEKDEAEETTDSENEISFEDANAEGTEVRVLKDGNWEGTLELIDGSWTFFPDDSQVDPVDYENDNLKEVEEQIRLEHQALANELEEG